jgi:hypothetical protein
MPLLLQLSSLFDIEASISDICFARQVFTQIAIADVPC